MAARCWWKVVVQLTNDLRNLVSAHSGSRARINCCTVLLHSTQVSRRVEKCTTATLAQLRAMPSPLGLARGEQAVGGGGDRSTPRQLLLVL